MSYSMCLHATQPWSNSIYDRGCARVARAFFNVLDLNRGGGGGGGGGGGCARIEKTIDHRGYRIVFNLKFLPTPDRLLSSRDRG